MIFKHSDISQGLARIENTMKTKKLFIVLIIVLLGTTLLFPKTKEQKYCNQFSGESDIENLSENYKVCQNDLRCKIETGSIATKEIDPSIIKFMCIPEGQIIKSSNNQKNQPLPK